MKQPTHQFDQDRLSQGETLPQTERCLLTSVIMLIAAVFLFAYNLYTAIADPVWQQFTMVVVSGLFVLLAAIGIWLIRRGRDGAGIALEIGGVLLISLAGAFLYSGLGWLFALIAVVLTSLIAGVTLPRGRASVAIVTSVGVGILSLLPDFLELPGRITAVSPLAAWIVAGILVFVFAVFLIRQFPNYTLSTKLIITFLVVTLVSLALLTLLNTWATQRALTDAANQKLLGSATQTAASVDAFITDNMDAVRVQAQLPLVIGYLNLPANQRPGSSLGVQVAAIFRALSRKDKVFISSYALLDSQGIDVLDTYASDIGLDKSDRDYFQIPMETGLPYASDVRFSDMADELAVYFSAPVRNAAGESIGVLRVRYKAAILQRLVFQGNALAGAESFAVLLDENHVRLAHGTQTELILKSVVPLEESRLAELKSAGRLPDWPLERLSTDLPGFEQGLKNLSGQPFFEAELHGAGHGLEQVGGTRLKTKDWTLIFAQPRDVFLAPVQAQTRATLLAALGIAAVVALAAVILGQLLAGPIVRLTEAARQVTAGDMTVQARVENQDETGQLAAVFNTMTAQLRELIGSLEDQVRERTAELAVSMEVGQKASAIRDLSELLSTITGFIRERFNLYYTQIYFVDDLGQNLILRAGTGTVGEELLARRHSLPVGGLSIVGRAAAEGQAVIVSDTADSDIHKPNPLLPDTRSELAIPLTVEGQVIGVLDMQADRPNAFTMQNLTVFEAMATQVALSIDGAEQWAVAQQARQRAEEAARRLTHESWAARLAGQKEGLGYVYDLASVKPLGVAGEGPNGKGLSASVVIQNEPIGRLSVETPPSKTWSEEERALVKAVAQQLAQKAENLRLFEATQQRAAREQLARRITDKVRASRDIETALKTAAEELSKALGTTKTVVDLKVTVEADENGQTPVEPEEQAVDET